MKKKFIGSLLVVYIIYCGLPEVVDTRQSLDNDSGKFIMVKIEPFLLFIVFVSHNPVKIGLVLTTSDTSYSYTINMKKSSYYFCDIIRFF